MPSRKKQTNKRATSVTVHVIFYPIVTFAFIFWVLYRSLFSFPIWFDEVVGKALFFGLPVWIYSIVTRFSAIPESLAPYKLRIGLLYGILAGGLFGFTTSLLHLLQSQSGVAPVELFSSPIFWAEFFLAVCTAFWETLLFFSFIMSVILHRYRTWSVTQQVLLTVGIFVLFHLPNTLLRADPSIVMTQVLLLTLFGTGQALLYMARRNAYMLILTHAIWGMVLLTHAW